MAVDMNGADASIARKQDSNEPRTPVNAPDVIASQITPLLVAHEERLQNQLDQFIERQENILKQFCSKASTRSSRSSSGILNNEPRLSQKVIEIGNDIIPEKVKHLVSQNEAGNLQELQDQPKGVRFNTTTEVAIVSCSPDESKFVLSACVNQSTPLSVAPSQRGTESVNPWWRESKTVAAFTKAPISSLASLLQSKGWTKGSRTTYNNLSNLKPMSKSAMEELVRRRNMFQHLVMSSYFDSICAIVILANAALLGWQVEDMAHRGSNNLAEWNTTAQKIFLCWYVVEFLLRCWAHGMHASLQDWEWNLFDLIAIAFSAVEAILAHATSPGQRHNFGIVRILKVLRLVRII
jgi:hypothetical protein